MVYYNNVVLVTAEIECFDITFFEANIPICYLGAVIKDHVNSVSMPIDMRIDLKPYNKFEKHLLRMKKENRKCDLVGISTMTASFPNAIKLAKIAKKHGACVVLGGYHPSALKEDMFDFPEIDMVIRGEGEMSFRELVLKGPSTLVKGLSFRDENGIVHHNPDREKITDLDSLPFPDRRLRQDNLIYKKHDVIVTSRGCNGACTFCANSVVHGRWRGRSPENVVAELKMLYDKNHDLIIHIWDANFMQDSERVAKIIDLIKENEIRFKYFCEMRVDAIIKHPNLIKDLAKIGVEWIAIGIESPNQECLKKLKKGITIANVENAINILKGNKIKIVGYLMIGDPEETAEQMKEYPLYATRVGIDKIMLAIQTPHPGSLFFKNMKEKEAITSFEWEKYDIGHSVAKLNHMTNHECEVLMDWCWGKFFHPEWAFSQKESLKDGLYHYISIVWIGYPCFLIHARPGKSAEENLKAYISAMRGFFDLSKYKFTDSDYLNYLRGCDLQVSFLFSDGDLISLLASVDEYNKLTIEVFDGKRKNVFLDFTIKSSDFIDSLRKLPQQTASLVYWAGYNFTNWNANIKVFKIFSSIVKKSFRLNPINYDDIKKFFVLGTKLLPKKIFELISEEIPFLRGKRKKPVLEGNILKNLTNSFKRLLYKVINLPYTLVVPVE